MTARKYAEFKPAGGRPKFSFFLRITKPAATPTMMGSKKNSVQMMAAIGQMFDARGGIKKRAHAPTKTPATMERLILQTANRDLSDISKESGDRMQNPNSAISERGTLSGSTSERKENTATAPQRKAEMPVMKFEGFRIKEGLVGAF